MHYDEDSVDVTPGFVSQLNRTLNNLGDKQNVVVKFVGFTDDQPLTGRIKSIYGNHDALSKARARRVALAVQDELALATAAVESDGRGASRPLASNETSEGRALNRRVEVEFWYDDPLQDLPDEPQMCPGEPGAEMVTRVYDPPWGDIKHVELDAGQPVLPAGYGETLTGRSATLPAKPTLDCDLSAIPVTNDWTAVPLWFTAMTSVCRRHERDARWKRLPTN